MISFTKMNGTGNDFIVFDNRSKYFNGNETTYFQKICQRRMGIGADGVLLFEESQSVDFKMRYFNADGSESMCGNGARCIAFWAFRNSITGNEVTFETANGIHHARTQGQSVRLQMTPVFDLNLELELPLNGGLKVLGGINTGVPHCVLSTEDVERIDVFRTGRDVRYNPLFPEGTNVNFIHMIDQHTIQMRTYERGVEAETLACGTGAVASAIIASLTGDVQSPVNIKACGGDLAVDFDADFQTIYLEGEVEVVYEGVVDKPDC